MRQNIRKYMDNISNAKKKEEEKSTEIVITLPTHAYFLTGIRDFTLSLIRNTTDFSEQWAYRFQSVIDELCNNAIEHGSSPGKTIQLKFINNPNDSIEIIVEDTGTGPKPMKAEILQKYVDKTRKESDSTLLEKFRGRGLSKIVYEWTDEFEVKDKPGGGLIIRVKKYLKDAKTKELKQELSLAGNQTHIVV